MNEQNVHIEEQFLAKKAEQDAMRFESKFGSIIDEAAETFNEAYGTHKQWTQHDTVGLGQYLETWESYAQMFEDDATTRDHLGDYLKVGLGLAAIQYVTLPATFLASVQPLADEVGLVYYRELVATQTRGNITQGDVIGSQQGKLSHDLDGYYGEELTSSTAVVATTQTYTPTLSAPVRQRTMTITITITGGANAGTYRGLDDGEGNLIGNWPTAAAGGAATGTIDYSNGAVSISLDDTAATAGSIIIVYHQNLAQAANIPGFLYRLASKSIRVNYFILENQYSTLSDYAVRRRFGRALSDDVASASVAQINSAVLSSIIRKLNQAAITTGTANWDAAVPAGVSVADHRRTFPDSFEAAAQLIDAVTGRGAISFIVAGSYARRILSTLGVDMVRKPLPGPYLTGFFQNIPVFYAPATLLPDDEVLVGYRGPSWFEAPVVYSPFLPVVMVKGTGSNVFNRVTGTAHAAGVDTVMTGFCAKVKILNM
jgi:hypothetical protein